MTTSIHVMSATGGWEAVITVNVSPAEAARRLRAAGLQARAHLGAVLVNADKEIKNGVG